MSSKKMGNIFCPPEQECQKNEEEEPQLFAFSGLAIVDVDSMQELQMEDSLTTNDTTVKTDVEMEEELGNLASCIIVDSNGYYHDRKAHLCASSDVEGSLPDLPKPDPSIFLPERCMKLLEVCTLHKKPTSNDNETQFVVLPELSVQLIENACTDLRKCCAPGATASQRFANLANSLALLNPLFQSIVCTESKCSEQYTQMRDSFFAAFPEEQYRKKQVGEGKNIEFVRGKKDRVPFFLSPVFGGKVDVCNCWIVGTCKSLRKSSTIRPIYKDLVQYGEYRSWLNLHQKHCPIEIWHGNRISAEQALIRGAKIDEELINGIVVAHEATADEIRAVGTLQSQLNDIIHKSNFFRPRGNFCYRLSVYGSSFTKLTVQGSDVDLSLDFVDMRNGKHNMGRSHLDPRLVDTNATGEKLELQKAKAKKKSVYALKWLLTKHGYSSVEAIPMARIPLVSARSRTFSFDICFDNSIAVLNSTLLREYAKLDYRVKALILLVKVWARANKIGSAKDCHLSSYTW